MSARTVRAEPSRFEGEFRLGDALRESRRQTEDSRPWRQPTPMHRPCLSGHETHHRSGVVAGERKSYALVEAGGSAGTSNSPSNRGYRGCMQRMDHEIVAGAGVADAVRAPRLHNGDMRALVLYASRHGHTQRVAERIAAALGKRSWIPDLRDVASDPPAGLEKYAAVILASPIHLGRHARSIVSFARRYHQALGALPSAFVSVSLTQTNAESLTVDAEQRKRAQDEISVVLDRFIETTGWQPRAIIRVAGALAYSRYNLFVRWMMKRIARARGGSTDTSQDHVYTNWAALEHSIFDFVEGVEQSGDVSDVSAGG